MVRAHLGRPTGRRVGVGLCLSACALGGLNPLFIDLLADADVSVETMLGLRWLLASVVVACWVIMRPGSRAVASPHRTRPGVGTVGRLSVATACYVAQATFFFYTVRQAGGAVATMLLYVYPVVVVLGHAVFARARTSASEMIAVGIALVGVGALLTPSSEHRVVIGGIVLGLATAAANAGYVMASESVLANVDPALLTTCLFGGSGLAMASYGVATGGWDLDLGRTEWVYVLGFSLASTALPTVAFMSGISLIGAKAASTISCVEPAVTTLLLIVLRSEGLALTQWLGLAAISAAAVLAARRPGSSRSAAVAGLPSVGRPPAPARPGARRHERRE
ncbi:DMT family transporter [Nocardioides agariphilus]|uniref:DMT family transporter n=1 Tax=Nocardioides agariphilus TaxID=433664 RepID=A0A930YI45_9ACTN|nr:DMT family transporter [Nocardioides agariphilus]MBF4769346.1 DMT family transporter [Nocardioides agariphilus]